MSWYSLTREGQQALKAHLKAMEDVIKLAKTELSACSETPARSLRDIGSLDGYSLSDMHTADSPSAPPAIRKTPGVCGGNACVRDTRIPVWTLQRLRELGSTDAQLLENFPALRPPDLVAAWEYVRLNRSEIVVEVSR